MYQSNHGGIKPGKINGGGIKPLPSTHFLFIKTHKIRVQPNFLNKHLYNN